jgi:hypothetical protein
MFLSGSPCTAYDSRSMKSFLLLTETHRKILPLTADRRTRQLMDELRRLTQKDRSLVAEHQRIVLQFKSTLRELHELRKQKRPN